MTGPEKLSVLLPVYNTRADWLSVAIESVLSQTYRDFELLLLNDGSTNPDTLATLAAFEKADDRVRLIHNPENMGLAKTLNRGLTLARYDWIARMDSDDISEPQRFEKQVEFFKTHPDITVLGTGMNMFGELEAAGQNPEHHDEIATMMLNRCAIAHPTVMFRKNPILASGGYPIDYPNAEDYALWTKLIFHHPEVRFANLPALLLRYRLIRSRPAYVKTQEESAIRIRAAAFAALGVPGLLLPYFAKPARKRISGKKLKAYEDALSRIFIALQRQPYIIDDTFRERMQYILQKAVKRALPSPYALRRMGSLLFRREAYLDSLFPRKAPTKPAADSLYSK
ncbi:glycosyltransferase [Sutterella megalosphaeroides]|uniref:Glycosyltransferase 2-like domain-containing protein n=1 Tax=Sutterella megalosphaeroides TaxID=2494234 RepID=A0A2Z6ID69_9BURK|nr:glycosyltransferase [Sutterella megalosphaeroides]BBF22586.1 hypothetical protein SUTMEG_04770 [Sutterella megalosphaeroides]